MGTRAFVAIELPPAVRDELARAQDALRSELPHIRDRWVKPDRMHLTLAFLGDIAEASVAPLVDALNEAGKTAAPFELRLEGIGGFPSPRRPQILWAGVDPPPDALLVLNKKVVDAARPFAPQMDGKKFSPHIALARADAIRSAEASRVAEVMHRWEGRHFGTCKVNEIGLIQSKLTNTGPEYSSLGHVPFGH